MQVSKEDYRGFYISHRSYYGDHIKKKDVMFGYYSLGGGTSCEIAMEWHNINNEEVPRLQAFEDSWHGLSLMGDVIEKLAQVDGNITVDEFTGILLSCGFKDVTEYTAPWLKSDLKNRLKELEEEKVQIEAKLKEMA